MSANWDSENTRAGVWSAPNITLDDFKKSILDLIKRAKDSGVDVVDIYDALNDEAAAFGNSFKLVVN